MGIDDLKIGDLVLHKTNSKVLYLVTKVKVYGYEEGVIACVHINKKGERFLEYIPAIELTKVEKGTPNDT